MNLIKSLVATALLATSFSTSAAVFDLGTLKNGELTLATSNIYHLGATGTAFVDYFTFKLSETSNAAVNVAQTQFFNLLNITNGNVALFSGDHTKASATQLGAANTFNASKSFSNLGAGTYFFKVTGLANGTFGGSYTLGTTAIAQPVPEPETYALMGMGLVGLLAARRRKAKTA